jgi:hypothetical protein
MCLAGVAKRITAHGIDRKQGRNTKGIAAGHWQLPIAAVQCAD